MRLASVLRWSAAGAITLMLVDGAAALAQATPGQTTPTRPRTRGGAITAKDGDTILLDGDARITVIRRRPAFVRTIFNPAEHWLVLVADYPPEGGGTPDGTVDESFHFREITGDWPLEERWQGEAVVEDYWSPERPAGVGFRLPVGLVQLLGPPGASDFKNATAVATLSYNGGGRSSARGLTFEVAEQQVIASIARSSVTRTASTPIVGPDGSARGAISSTVTMRAGPLPAPDAAVRVGGNVRAPQKLVDVLPVPPERAREAGVRGIVILEVTIDTVGTVKDVRVLRSIPWLDAAAMEAVRQWRYEPTLLNGAPVPVIMTVPVTVQ